MPLRDKDTDKRGQKQACLHFAEREYLGRQPKIRISRNKELVACILPSKSILGKAKIRISERKSKFICIFPPRISPRPQFPERKGCRLEKISYICP
jgi:activator of HSP90 ATPase